MGSAAGGAAYGAQKTYEQIVDVFEMLFGKHPGYRRVHAKGVLCGGTFKASSAAATLSRAAHLSGREVPVTVRFSDFAGIPAIPDGDPNASPRGIAIRFHLPDKTETDIVAHSVDAFPAATAEEFLEFARALGETVSAPAAKPSALELLFAKRPAARNFVEAPKPAPVSFATEAYYGINAFRFINAQGVARYVRYRILPIAGQQYLADSQAAKQPINYLFDELQARFRGGSAQFRLVAQVAAEGDNVTNGTVSWPADRELVELGTLNLTQSIEDSAARERVLIFDPTHLTDGIENSGDPVIEARSKIYGISYDRRNPK